MVMQCLGFFQHATSDGEILKFDLNKYTSNSSKGPKERSKKKFCPTINKRLLISITSLLAMLTN